MIGEETEIKDIMTRGVVTVPFELTAAEMAETMAKNNVSAVVAVDASGETFGIVSDMDILEHIQKKNWEIASVEDIMSQSVETLRPTMTVKEAATIMAEKHVHRLIVMSEENVGASYRPVGILSARDIIRHLFEK